MEFVLQNGFPGGLLDGDRSNLALEVAAESGHLNAVKWLLEHFEAPDKIMRKAVRNAEDYGHRDVAQFLRSRMGA